ncbi:MAG: cytochrome c oxidase subunit 3 [Saprospiraceae bacterium]|jgi:cytochrome c oxidase subunit 3|nr:cytochrome c oxidase subunit 3 [Saprospiraceae bacterium]
MEQTIIHNRNKIHPQKFALWASLASILMMFGAFTSAYIVKQSAGNWLEFSLPASFYFSTALLVLSSITLHISQRSFVRQQISKYKIFLGVSFLLGILFVVLQYAGWTELYDKGVDLKGNVSGSFFYLLSGIHALHVLGGLAALMVAVIHAFSLGNHVTPARKHRFDLVVTYWHFVDALWVYLFVFLIISK